jgi:NitT/TauT family transport system substrate-binding protein
VGCHGGPAAGSPEKVTLAVAQLPHSALVHLAIAKGYFAAEGLDVIVLRFPFGKPALDAVLEGKADLGTCAETPFVLAVLQERQALWLATVASSTANTVLVARSDAGINSPAGIRGKRIGYARGTNGEFFLNSLLVRHGLDDDAVQRVDLKPDEMPDAMARGLVDGVVIWNPINGRIATQMGDGARTFSAQDLYFESLGIVARPGFVRDHPGRARKVMRALLRAEVFARTSPAQARPIVAQEGGLDPRETEASWTVFVFEVRLDQSLLPLLEEEARWAIRRGLVSRQGTPNFLRSLDAGPLLSVKPDAVTIMR